MGTFWRWIHRSRELLGRRRANRELDAEMQFHVDMDSRQRIAKGMDPREARREAMIQFGGADRYREQVRGQRFGARAENFARDLRYGFRSLRRAPAFTLAALVTLALGIGANTAAFSAVRAVLLRPLPYGDPGDVYRIQTSWQGNPDGSISPAEFLDYRERLVDIAEAVGVYSFGTVNLAGETEPTIARAAFVSAGFFAALGVAPDRGRVFDAAEDEANLSLVVVSHGFWTNWLAADPNALGRSILVNGRENQIVGVMPPGFRAPEDVLSGQETAIYAPQGITPAEVSNRGSHYLFGVFRVRPGVSSERAVGAIQETGRWMVSTFPDDTPNGFSISATPLAAHLTGSLRTPLLVLLAGAAIVLLIACSNVANLMLARSESRRKEYSIRASLGAQGSRLVGQATAEAILLGGSGALLGVALAWASLRTLAASGGSVLPWLADARMDLGVLAFTAAVSIATAVGLGLVPALQAGRSDANSLLGSSDRGSSSGRGARRLRSGLMVVELAVSLVLLVGGGLLVRSFSALIRVDPGFSTEGVLTSALSLAPASYPENDQRTAFFRQLIPELAAIPGVTAVGGVTNLPLATGLGDLNFVIDGRPVLEGELSPRADWQVVTPGYFDAMGVSLLQGRVIESGDDAQAIGVVVINRALAEQYWPGQDPLGERFELGGGSGPGWVSVIGIVNDVRHEGLERSQPTAQMYLAHEQFRFWGSGRAVTSLALVFETERPASELASQVRATVRALDPTIPLRPFQTMAEVRGTSLALPRMLTQLIGTFGVLALILTGIGLYGIIAYSVGRRVREFGIRSALGATAGQVLTSVLREGAGLVVIGIALGLVAAWGATRTLGSVLYDVEPADPLVFGGIVGALAAVSLMAMLLPAMRATRVSPVQALRND